MPAVRALRQFILLILCLAVTGCSRAELLQALDERQANEVVAVLLHSNIAAAKHNRGKTGFAVEVGTSDLAEAIDIVQMQGLPSSPRTQIAAMFPSDSMVSTPLAERARLLSAIEQRLEESLAALAGVHSARVHVSYDAGPVEGSLQQQRPPAMHVAAVLIHGQTADDQALLVTAKRFLRNAFVDVSYDNVSIVLAPAQELRALGITRASESFPAWALLAMPLFLLLVLGALIWWLHDRGDVRIGRLQARLRKRGVEG